MRERGATAGCRQGMAAIDLVLAIGVVGVSAFALYFLAEKAFVNYSHVVSVMVGWPYV